jgi:transposase
MYTMVSWRQKIRNLEHQLELKDTINKKQEEKIKLLEQHVLHLENRLRKYINENTPSSQKPDYDKDKKKPDKPKKPKGKPKGSNGGTRQTPEIDKEEIIRLEEDEAYLGEPIDYVERIVGDIEPISPVKWTRFLLAQYKDPATHDIITATHPDCPSKGVFGPNLRALIALLRERARLSEGQTIEFLGALYGIPIASATIEAELRRTADTLKPQYDSLGKIISDTKVKHSDETGQSLNGENWCMYCFSTQQHTYFFAEEKKLAEHIKSRLDRDWENVLTCDGHSIYTWYYAKQRCWSHGTRKDRWLYEEKKTEERILLHNGITGTFKIAKDIWKKTGAGAHQLWNVLLLKNRLKKITKYNWLEDKCQKVANYFKNGWDSWFTFMFVPGVEPTNNLNENDIRKHVMKRKVSGTYRSEEGLRNHCVILSLFETWRKSGKNVYHTLIDILKLQNNTISWSP